MIEEKRQYTKDLKIEILKVFLRNGSMNANQALTALSETIFTSRTGVYYAIKALERQSLLIKKGVARGKIGELYEANIRMIPKSILIEVFGGAD